MLSLRAQLQAPMNSKVALAAMLLPDASVEGARCCGVLWLPHTNGHFLAAYTTGTILIYKKWSTCGSGPLTSLCGQGAVVNEEASKLSLSISPPELTPSAVVNEGTSKFSLSISSHASKPPAPTSTITVSGGGINDVAVCPAPTGFIAGEEHTTDKGNQPPQASWRMGYNKANNSSQSKRSMPDLVEKTEKGLPSLSMTFCGNVPSRGSWKMERVLPGEVFWSDPMETLISDSVMDLGVREYCNTQVKMQLMKQLSSRRLRGRCRGNA
eukprot:1159873-Pelagomonas_calceolata.AAC.20